MLDVLLVPASPSPKLNSSIQGLRAAQVQQVTKLHVKKVIPARAMLSSRSPGLDDGMMSCGRLCYGAFQGRVSTTASHLVTATASIGVRRGMLTGGGG